MCGNGGGLSHDRDIILLSLGGGHSRDRCGSLLLIDGGVGGASWRGQYDSCG
jgi:hypothetical protein